MAEPEELDLTWKWQPFDRVSPIELYQMLELRQQVFVVEQHCVYLDADGRDSLCIHGFAFATTTSPDSQVVEGRLLAYARVLPAGLAFPTVSIGRVVVAPVARGTGLGRRLMIEAIREASTRFPHQPITIGAQHRLVGFYQDLGFVPISEPYDEDGIVHVDMIREG